jgi:hypothetical protein
LHQRNAIAVPAHFLEIARGLAALLASYGRSCFTMEQPRAAFLIGFDASRERR